VFVGKDGLGEWTWKLEEVDLAIDRAVAQRGFRVIPVLLPGVTEPFDPNGLPHFLRSRTWVDFRRGGNDKRALQDLINAVHGVPCGPEAAVLQDDSVAPAVAASPLANLLDWPWALTGAGALWAVAVGGLLSARHPPDAA
jgi:hypothetical protein